MRYFYVQGRSLKLNKISEKIPKKTNYIPIYIIHLSPIGEKFVQNFAFKTITTQYMSSNFGSLIIKIKVKYALKRDINR